MWDALKSTYGARAQEQISRYKAAVDAFRAIYGPGDVAVFRAPGRVNLIGEHTDYNQGYVMPVALDKDILLLARPRSDNLVRLANVEAIFPRRSFRISSVIPSGPEHDWGNYARGAAQAVARHLSRPLQGFDGLVAAQPPHGVPREAGLSSSSALTVVTAVAIADVNGWEAEPGSLAKLCAKAEWYVGTRGGIMDQFVALLPRRDHALFLDCRADADGQYPMDHVPLPRGYRLLIVDSGVHRQNVRGCYNLRVAACRAAVGLLRAHFGGITHLRDVQDVPWDELARLLPQAVTVGELHEQGVDLTDIPTLAPDKLLKVRTRCRHVWTENRRVLAAVEAMRSQKVASLGRLLDEAHASARDDYEISCPELEMLVQAAREVPGVAGARVTGAGWGGCIVALVDEDVVPAFETHVADRYREAMGRIPYVFACRPSLGAGRVLDAARVD